MKNTVDAAHNAGIPVSLCGEMAGDSLHTDKILALGIHSISINASNIPMIKDIIRNISLT